MVITLLAPVCNLKENPFKCPETYNYNIGIVSSNARFLTDTHEGDLRTSTPTVRRRTNDRKIFKSSLACPSQQLFSPKPKHTAAPSSQKHIWNKLLYLLPLLWLSCCIYDSPALPYVTEIRLAIQSPETLLAVPLHRQTMLDCNALSTAAGDLRATIIDIFMTEILLLSLLLSFYYYYHCCVVFIVIYIISFFCIIINLERYDQSLL